MGIFFEDQAFEFETIRTLNYYNYQGAEIGEVQTITNQIKEGDFTSWYNEWYGMAERVNQLADQSMKGHHFVSAKEAFLRASNYFRAAEFFLKNNEPKRIECYKKSVKAFRNAMVLVDVSYSQINIPFKGYYLSSYLYMVDKNAPTLIFIGGYDSTVEELYFAGGAAAIKRGFNVLIFDGPGQGETLRIQNVVAQYDFEKPVTAVLDYLDQHTEVNTNHFIALMGMSLGGYYAARAAAFEKRINVCILFDVFTDVWDAITEKNPFLKNIDHMQSNDMKIDLNRLDANASWLIQNGLWVFGCKNIFELPAVVKKYTVKNIADQISCPTLLLAGTHDHFASISQLDNLKEKLICPYDEFVFDTTFGAQAHCQEGNQSLASQVIFDWTEDQIKKFKER
ncbi:alpha/beta hydrolase family protein [Sporolactobacillus pectinivorans]|uniref:alpha/beta hydrolase family protein n=1 Tax=Sporolactobacillus pectinivorans TaxID=1591408 RepID=UPI000C2675F9|nr:alpha/beta fold hydrolase [Sporolactobacillus pectinivorans]